MSWAEEDWTVGLSGRVLQKVKELQVHQERLSRENKQKELQLDNIHTSLEKQTVKYEEVRGELQSVQRELQRVQDEAKAAVTSGERLTQELQTKQAQVCSFEGQLDSARTLNNKLTQEVKRLEAELEKLQNSSRSADTTLFSTPCWNTSSPWEQNGSRKEERSANKDEGQNRSLNSRQRLQFSEVATASLPRQQHRNTPSRNPSDQSDSFSTPLGAFPWERDDSRPAARRRSPPSPKMPCAEVISQGQSEQGVCGKEKDYRAETDTLRSRLSALEGELCSKATTLKSIQSDLTQSKKELAAKEISAQKSRDELSLAHTRIGQESERASGAEQRLKQLQEELKCQRQNAESSRLQHQQRLKELEKQHQRDLTELQKERQCLEKQHQQEVNKLNQEIQQARTLHNALQAQHDKLSLQKQALDKELDTLKEKLKWTEGQLQESQKKEAQTQAKLTEAVREAEGVAVSLEQSRKKERALEEEGRRLAEERADALRLLKELQEQKDAPAPILQPVQFCPVGQSFSPQPSYSLNSRQSPHLRRSTTATLAEQKRGEDVDKRRAEITASYPSGREPGEGIDSEHINVVLSSDAECLQREGHRKRSEEENKRENETIESDSSGRNKHSTFDHALSTLPHSAAGRSTNNSMDGDRCDLMLSAEETPHKPEQAKASEDLKRENAGLRSELHDVREELQKRLEDLEAQRRAEAEARTRLKQLSRKHASQSVEKNEQDKQWRAQLESEKAETERLRKTIASLETEMKQGKERREKNEREEVDDKNKALEDRESEMIELNIQLKKQLSDVKAQLALEREERKREEEDRNQITNADIDIKKDLSMKLEELKTELEELKRSRTEDSLEDEKLSVANSPLTYLTLHDDELNSNMVHSDEFLRSPEQHLLFCQSTNQHNMLVSRAAADLIQEERTVINPEVSSDLEDTRQNYLVGSSLSDSSVKISGAQKEESCTSDLVKEVKHLQKEKAKETERANQYQVKLEALQSQVTRQTQQLTMAFEKQSQHISGLLAELQEKERSLLSQGEELQRYKQEVDALKARKQEEEMTVREVEDGEQKEGHRDESSAEISGLQPNQEKKVAVSSVTINSQADSVSNAQRDAGQQSAEIITSERPTPNTDSEALWSGEQHPDKTQSNHDLTCVMGETESIQVGGTADVVTELLALRQENELLKQRISGLTVSDTSAPVLHIDVENQEDPVNQSQNTGNASLPCLMEQRSPSSLNDISNGVQQSAILNVKRIEDEGGDSEREDGKTTGTEEVLEAVCPLQIQRLQQQVVELNMKVQVLSEENQQQAEELAVWRLTSQPAPSFELTNTNKQSETQDKISAIRQSNQQQTDAMMQAQVQAPHLDALKAQKQEEEMTVKDVEDGEQKEGDRDESSVEISGLQPNQEKEGAVSSITTNSQADSVSNAQRDAGQQSAEMITSKRLTPITDSEALWSGEQHPDKTQGNHDLTCVMGETESSEDGGTADVVTELLALPQENQLLKQRISSLTVSDTSAPVLHIDVENQEDPVNQSQNTGNASLPCSVEQRSPSSLNDISNGVQQSAILNVKRIEDEGGDSEREDGKTTGTEEVLEAVCPLQIQRLQQQVVELNMKVRALSEETQQQAEELAVWRLTSQPAPSFDLTNTDNQSETQEKISAIRLSNQQQTDAMMQAQVQAPHLDAEESRGNITLIREDELLLSCSSSKLQGRMLFSRLQHSNLPGSKSFQPSKKTASPQEYIHDTAEIDKDSEKENQEITLSRQSNICQPQQKQKTENEVIQMSSEKTGQHHVTKDSHKVSGPKQTKTAECHMGNSEASRLTHEIKTNIDYSKGDARTKMKSISSQTEESLYPRSSLPAPELHCAFTQTEEEEEDNEDESVESPPVSPVPLCEEPVSADKILFSGSFPIPADPARLAERIRRNRTQLSAAFDDTEYEPYGLPEVVMKGFADIPSGPSCPYIVRRGLLGTSVVPVPQKNHKEEETD